jgi:hypothetical protein
MGNAGCDSCGTYDRVDGSHLCAHCLADVRNGIKVGDLVRLEFWAGQVSEVEGTIEAIDPCDGNGCEKHAKTPIEPGEVCGDDYVILAEDKDMAYFRHQVAEIR